MNRQYWGILGAGKISNDFVNALNDPTGPAAEFSKVVAVAARQVDRAKTFAEKHSIHTVYGDYQALADNGDIDVVYVGNTTGQHYDVVKMLLEANKHVLCEKSLTANLEQTKELFDLAKKKNLFLMEALWSNFLPTYKKVNEVISSGQIGDVLHVEVNFGVKIDEVLRIYSADLGGGAALDLGVYVVNLIRLAFQNEEPQEIMVRGDLFYSGVDASWDAIIVFKNNRRAIAKCSSRFQLDNHARITGSKGVIEIPEPMHCPTDILINREKFSIELPSKPAADYVFTNSAGLAYEGAAVCQALHKDQLECAEYTTADSLYIHKILDEITKQLKEHVQK